MPISRTILATGFIILLVTLITSPVMAGEKYSSGQPDISAGIAGSNELLIGQKTPLTVAISNAGLIDMKFVQEGAITPDYLPTTALTMTAHLEPGDCPIQVTADPQILGDIKSGDVVQATFPVTVPDQAVTGSYEIPLTISYQYMDQATQIGIDDIQYTFKNETKTLLLPVTIRRAVSLGITSVNTGDLNVGGEGHIIVTVKNVGSEKGNNTVFNIEPVGNSPIVPYQSSIYVGDYPIGETATLSYKVSVADNADPAISYPLKLYASYTDYQGLQAETVAKDISAGFKQKVAFSVINQPGTLEAGSKDVISVEYQNTGSVPVYNAQAGINIVDPFTSEDDQSYLGTVQPGGTATAMFKLNVNGDATPKQYALDSEIRYTDINQTEFVTDTIKVPVIVSNSSFGALILPAIVIILILLGGGFIYYRRMQKN
ncbi:MAG: NEW3 domain-containing protein [Methanospirillum sp.]|nr:NEW3 domain-containing protein [Methanospirillum sp.]